jgi:hypothetical protein
LASTPHRKARTGTLLLRPGDRDGASAALGIWSTLATGRGLVALDRKLARGEPPDSRPHDVFPAQRCSVAAYDTDAEQRTGARVLDSTGLKVYGAGEWQREKHGERGRRTWRKLPLAVNPDSGEILDSELTSNQVGDLSMVGPLLDQIPGSMASVLADGAYDAEPVYRAVAERQLPPPPAVIIPRGSPLC